MVSFPNIRQILNTTFIVCLLGISSHTFAIDLLNQPSRIIPLAKNYLQLSIASAGDRLVTVGERGYILTSDDDGASWQQSQAPVSVTLASVFFSSEKIGWAVGHGGVVLKTTDAGTTWRKTFDGVKAAEIELIAAKAANDQSRPAIWREKEAQRLVTSGPDKPFLDVFFFDDNKGLIIGAYGLAFSTIDSGKTWHSLVGQIPNRMGMHLYNILLLNNDLYIVGERGVVFKADKDILNFEKINTPYEGSFFGIMSSKADDIIIFGLRGNIYRSSAGQTEWEHIPMPKPVSLTAGKQLKNGDLVLVDETGQLFQSINNGKTFTPSNLSKTSALTDITETDDGHLVMTSARGIRRYNLQDDTAGDK
jgi:photosystem II stability/assembly factor-like uncharacterized protein